MPCETEIQTDGENVVCAEAVEGMSPEKRLAHALPRWLQLPVYRLRTALTDERSATNFYDLPFTTKRDLRNGFPHNFLPAGQALETLIAEAKVELEHTSGTSEERTPVLLGRGWWQQQEARALRLNSFVGQVLVEHPQARRVLLTTPMCNGMVCESNWSPPSARMFENTLSVNHARIPFLVSESELARMAREILEWSPLFLELDPVHGAWFALYCERNHIRFPSVKFVLCSYEYLSVVHRRILERVFQVPVFDLYGSTETGHLLMQDEAGFMQPSTHTAFLEIVKPDRHGVGDLIVTTLSNDYMPLLRYRIGDLAQRLGCGRATTYVVHGRARDAITLPNGNRVTVRQVDRCFGQAEGIAHYQLRQTAPESFSLRYVPENRSPNPSTLRAVVDELETLLETTEEITAEALPWLPPSVSGKFRLTSPSEE